MLIVGDWTSCSIWVRLGLLRPKWPTSLGDKLRGFVSEGMIGVTQTTTWLKMALLPDVTARWPRAGGSNCFCEAESR
jgi:hypothetical protein